MRLGKSGIHSMGRKQVQPYSSQSGKIHRIAPLVQHGANHPQGPDTTDKMIFNRELCFGLSEANFRLSVNNWFKSYQHTWTWHIPVIVAFAEIWDGLSPFAVPLFRSGTNFSRCSLPPSTSQASDPDPPQGLAIWPRGPSSCGSKEKLL
uniref:Uncharacterized protein n=1 Tax=Cryptomonas curvata TaxID=233186 RepID=A0A7S0QHW1_9CRYP|mmetsp:Transcript_29833/g.62550  ORF Transcript_29833/g.62550 Transcript_29833/m.62550 type:complete len:149 (+) Transcript_29833:129-575(+)